MTTKAKPKGLRVFALDQSTNWRAASAPAAFRQAMTLRSQLHRGGTIPLRFDTDARSLAPIARNSERYAVICM